MATTVLGKRNRSNLPTSQPPRRVLVNQPNDEKENPFIVRGSHACIDGDEVPGTATKKLRTASSRNTAVKAPLCRSKSSLSTKLTTLPHVDDKENVLTPSTPRHRDALAKKVPVTPRHRVLVAGTQKTPRTPATPSSASTAVYNQARKLFSRCTAPGMLVGRDEERKELENFLERRMLSTGTGCMYVSGPPGTGKSAVVNEVVQQQQGVFGFVASTINCMSLRGVKDLSAKLMKDFGLQEEISPEQVRSWSKHSKTMKGKKFLLVLDEIDRLVDLDTGLLYGLIEASLARDSQLVVIGIANALDLTDRFLPRLKGRGLKPELLPFMPYTAPQIASVITCKLKTLACSGEQTIPFMHPAAIQFCAKKVASQTGDLRKAFDICRRAIDAVEQETRARDTEAALQRSPTQTPLMENINLSSPSTPRSPLKGRNDRPVPPVYTTESAPKASIAHMAKVTAMVFGNGTTQRLNTLNLQQKAVLCSLAALEHRKRDQQVEAAVSVTPSKKASFTSPTIKELFDAYGKLCKQENFLAALSSVEFKDVVSGLEALSLVLDVDGRSGALAMPMTPSRTPGRKPKAVANFGTAARNVEDKRLASALGLKELATAVESAAGGELLREILRSDGLMWR